jgi:hypothetical protein
MYATGKYSDADIAQWMNQQRVIQKLRKGRMPINKEMIRDMLQNQIYTGRVRHPNLVFRDILNLKFVVTHSNNGTAIPLKIVVGKT